MQYKTNITLTAADSENAVISVAFHADSKEQAAEKAVAVAEGAVKSGKWQTNINGYLYTEGGQEVGKFHNRNPGNK